MQAYLQPIRSAVYLFPFVALVFTLPYMAVQYRRYGAILALRTVIVYSFILYLMCAYLLTILPLPSRETVEGLTSPTLQLIPFYQLWDLWQSTGFVPWDPSTYRALLLSRNFFQMVANVVMFVPLGVYLRYFFARNARQVLRIALCISLFFELTQLTGLFFIYPRPYRLADVDDLITNTLGAMLGYLLAPLLTKPLPSRERMDAVAYRRGTYVSFTRRAFAALIDACMMLLLALVWLLLDTGLRRLLLGRDSQHLLWLLGIGYLACIALYFILGEWLWRGQTLGKRLLHIRLVDLRTGGRPRLWQCALRYGILYLVIMPQPLYVVLLALHAFENPHQRLVLGIAILLLLMVYVLFWLLVLIHAFTRSIQLLHDKLSQTRNISTVQAKAAAPGATPPQKSGLSGA